MHLGLLASIEWAICFKIVVFPLSAERR